MKNVYKYSLAFLAACVVPALCIVIPYGIDTLKLNDGYGWLRIQNFGLTALFISSCHVILLGVPLLMFMNVKKMVFWWSSILAGFVLGCIPMAFWTWPLRYADGTKYSRQWDGEKMVDHIVDGVVTSAGWQAYIEAVAFIGVFGAIGGLAFWVVFRAVSPNNHLQSDAATPRA